MRAYEIREQRELAGITQEELARRLGVTVSTVSRWENGHHIPTSLARRVIREWMEEISDKKVESQDA